MINIQCSEFQAGGRAKRFGSSWAALCFSFCFPQLLLRDEPPKNVLLFYSDDPSLPGTVLVNQAIRSTLKDKWKSPIQIYDEGQDSFRIPNEKYEAELVSASATEI